GQGKPHPYYTRTNCPFHMIGLKRRSLNIVGATSSKGGGKPSPYYTRVKRPFHSIMLKRRSRSIVGATLAVALDIHRLCFRRLCCRMNWLMRFLCILWRNGLSGCMKFLWMHSRMAVFV